MTQPSALTSTGRPGTRAVTLISDLRMNTLPLVAATLVESSSVTVTLFPALVLMITFPIPNGDQTF